MNDKEWEELLKARFEELRTAIQDLNLIDFDNLECRDAVRSIVGVKLDERNFHLMSLAMALNERRGEGSMTLDEVVTHLNNLPLGLRIAELQRAEVLEAEPELAEALETETTNDNSPMKKEHWEHFVNLKPDDYNYEDLDSDADFFKAEVAPDAKSLEQLCEAYEEGLATGDYPPDVVDYVCALEDLVSEMQGKSFTDSSRIGQLEAENAALNSIKHKMSDLSFIEALQWMKDGNLVSRLSWSSKASFTYVNGFDFNLRENKRYKLFAVYIKSFDGKDEFIGVTDEMVEFGMLYFGKDFILDGIDDWYPVCSLETKDETFNKNQTLLT